MAGKWSDPGTANFQMKNKVILKAISGALRGREYVFDQHDTFLFGRSPDCHGNIGEDPYVSRHHFILEAKPPLARIRDLGSLNGTNINGVLYGSRIESSSAPTRTMESYVDLKDGDRIQVGNTKFLVGVTGIRPSGRVSEGSTRCKHCDAVINQQVEDTPISATDFCARCSQVFKDDPLQLLQDDESGVENATDFRFENWIIEKRIGRGGMGDVYLARRKSDGEKQALKLVVSDTDVDDDIQRRFLREIDVLKDLKHPNIVRLYESGRRGATFYFFMEYCRYGTLTHLVKQHRGAVPLKIALKTIPQILDGASYAHKQKFVHRDIKPENVLYTGNRDNVVAKIADFGMAKSFDSAGLSGMTATNTTGGTVEFMPREQLINFKYVKPTADVWSLGAVFYYMLTGHNPRNFDKNDDPVRVILEEPVVPIDKRPRLLPPPLVDFINRAIATDPEERYESATAFREAFDAVEPQIRKM